MLNYLTWSKLAGILLITLSVFSCNWNNRKVNKKVIVIHARGISYPDMIQYLDAKNPKSFFNHRASKKNIKKLQPIVNAVTISNMASFETGVYPSEHGITGHNYAIKEDGTFRLVNGFSQRFEKETFWEKADLQGLKVLKIGDLTLHGKYTTHTNVNTLAQGNQTGNTQVIPLIPSEADQADRLIRYKNLEGQSQFKLQQEHTDSIKFYQVQNTVDSNFLYIDHDYDHLNGSLVKVKKSEWVEITSDSLAETLSAFRVKWFGTNDTMQVYVRASYTNRGYPDSFINKINKEVGPSKGWPNIPLYSSGIIDDITLNEEINDEVDYVMDVFNFAAKQENYDLIMVDYPLMDRLGHAFLQLKRSSEKVQTFYADAFARMEEDFASIADYAQKNKYDLIITSGHGFSPVHTSVDLEIFLRKNKIKIDLQNPDWEAFGLPGKVSAHIYINDHPGENERKLILSKIENLFKTLVDENTNQQVIDEIYSKEDLVEIGLLHNNSGDLFVLLKPGYVFDNNRTENIFGTPTFKGDHGYSLKYEDAYGILIANSGCTSCKSTDISDMVEKILNLE